MRSAAMGWIVLAAAACANAEQPVATEAVGLPSGVRVLRDTTTFSDGPLLVEHADGRADTIAVAARRAWLLGGGTLVAWSSGAGAGGYEGEGEGFHLVPADSLRDVPPLAREVFPILDVQELVAPDGARWLALVMQDGGAGLPHVALVAPGRGTVYRAVRGRLVASDSAGLVIAVMRSEGDSSTIRETLSWQALAELPTLRMP